jgi:hypothetical protein
MNIVIHFIGLDVHKESVAVSIAPSNSTEVRHYGTIGGGLIKKLAHIQVLRARAPAKAIFFR